MNKVYRLPDLIYNLILFLCIYYLGFTFVAASFDKIIDPNSFFISISDYQITPLWMNNSVAIFLPWLELFCGLFLILSLSKKFRKLKLLDPSNDLIICMLIWFIIMLSIASYRGLDIDCGCGFSEKTTPLQRLVEDIVLLITSIIIKFRHKIKFFLNNNI